MGTVTSRQLDLHRFLGLAVCHSTTIDPRRLEHHNYTYWTGDIAALIVRGQLKYCLIAPQFPIYVSPKEAFDADTSIGSGRTAADGDAEGVYVDIAIVMPIVQPRYVEELGAVGGVLENESLHDFFEKFLPQKLPGLSPRCLWVSGFEAPLVGELKPGPTRHADKIDSFYVNLSGLLLQGMLQAEAQGLCLFCSWRFATQQVVLLLAGAGDHYRVRRVTRDWAVEELDGEPYTAKTLKKLKAAWMERGDVNLDSPDNDDLNAVEDGDWTEGQAVHMYGNPQDANQRQQKLNDQRTLRRIKRNAQSQKYLKALTTPPSQDRTVPLFTNEALNAIHPGGELFESRPPELYFGDSETTGWSRVLQLGSTLSNQYMAKIQDFIRQFEILEEDRRKKVFFAKALTKPAFNK
ncbi:hypothetical protein C8R45DRAFT_1217197 [Mycena sanguinolenta]|nr:hypothetical protein C8R45DRAFT_1217197 [Mycena sanguinolenta]